MDSSIVNSLKTAISLTNKGSATSHVQSVKRRQTSTYTQSLDLPKLEIYLAIVEKNPLC